MRNGLVGFVNVVVFGATLVINGCGGSGAGGAGGSSGGKGGGSVPPVAVIHEGG